MPTFKPLDIYEPLYFAGPEIRYIDLWGGRGRGGSYAASQYMIFKVMQPDYFRGYVSRAIYGDIEETIWQELIDRINDNKTIHSNEFRIEKGKKLTYLPTGNTIKAKGFKSGSSGRTANLKGFAGATHIVIDEAEEITEDQFNQLNDTFRTVKSNIQIIRVFNPPSKSHFIIRDFYTLTPIQLFDNTGKEIEGFYSAVPNGRTDHTAVFGTYLDNWKNINASSRRTYEGYKDSAATVEYYHNQIRGLVSGGARGVIFKQGLHWFKYSERPSLDFFKLFGLDFGGAGNVSDEPDGSSKTVFYELDINRATMSVYLKIHVYRGYIASEELYETVTRVQLRNKEQPGALILADNARQDKILEMQNMGFNVLGAKTKEGGSSAVVSGYDIIKQYTLYFEEDDINGQTEANNHKWAIDAKKNPTGQPEDKFKDVWDAIRYALVYYHINYNF